VSIIAWLIVGAIAGWVAGMIVPGDEGYGWVGAIVAGIIGALVGGWLVGIVTGVNYMDEFTIGTIIAAIIGAVIVVFIWRMLARRGVTT
jgi:uncharacterized membrane protein YeaQ/YmgE (transglycosylase-associated protein family)